jgi:hypothetical protein
MKVIICGGRNHRLTPEELVWLESLQRTIPITALVVGGATGVDTDAARWGTQRGLPVHCLRADWKTYGHMAGPIRNQQMLTAVLPDGGCIVFQGGRGTADMQRRAIKAGIAVWRYVDHPYAHD